MHLTNMGRVESLMARAQSAAVLAAKDGAGEAIPFYILIGCKLHVGVRPRD
jgi:hypothetical protein